MVIDKLQRIIQKNFRLLLRSKTSALIIILGPLILISLIGLAFSNSEPYGVTVATYAPEYNELSNSILSTMNEQRFHVERIVTEETCIQRVKQSKANICLVFPRDFAIGKSEVNNITFHVDYSKINLVWSVLDVISEKIASRTTEISRDLTGELVQVLQGTRTEVERSLPQVVDLSIKNAQLSTLGDDISENVNAMELSLDTKEFQVDTLENRVQLVISTAADAADRGLKIINDIQGNYGNYNMTASQQLALEGIFDSAEEDLSDLKDGLNDLYVPGNHSSLLGDLIRGLDGKLESTKQQLVSAANAREVVLGDVKNTKALLENSLDKINALQVSLDAVQGSIKGLEITDPSKIVSPIQTTIKPLTVDTHFNYLFPALIVLIIMITGVLLSSMLVIAEKKSTAFFRNFITPTHESIFLIGTFITAFIIMVSQLIIFLAVAGIFFKTNVFLTAATTFPIILIITIVFVFIGMFIGTLFHSEETTILAAISCCALLLFLSSTILPLESMPVALQRIADFNPFVLSEDLLRQSIIFDFGYNLIAGDLLLLTCYAVVLFALIVLLNHYLKIRTLYKIHKEKPQKKRMADQAAAVAAKPVAKHWWSIEKKPKPGATERFTEKPVEKSAEKKTESLSQKIETAQSPQLVQPKKRWWKFWEK